MGRKFAPFEIAVHFSEANRQVEIQEIIDNFYIKTIESVLAESTLLEEQKYEVLDCIASYHSSNAPIFVASVKCLS